MTNIILNNLEKLKNNKLFSTKELKKGDYLLKQGDIDENIYFIIDGEILVERYTDSTKKYTKDIAILTKGDFTGEGALNDNQAKQVNLKALQNTKVIYINANKGIRELMTIEPLLTTEILIHIIDITNKRLLATNRHLTANYQINKLIREIPEISKKYIFNIIEGIKKIIGNDYILFFEKHPVMDDFIILTYDTRFPGKLQNQAFEKEGKILNLSNIYNELNINENDDLYLKDINIGTEIMGFLLFGNSSTSFSKDEKMIISSISNSFSGVIKEYNNKKEEDNKKHLRGF